MVAGADLRLTSPGCTCPFGIDYVPRISLRIHHQGMMLGTIQRHLSYSDPVEQAGERRNLIYGFTGKVGQPAPATLFRLPLCGHTPGCY